MVVLVSTALSSSSLSPSEAEVTTSSLGRTGPPKKWKPPEHCKHTLVTGDRSFGQIPCRHLSGHLAESENLTTPRPQWHTATFNTSLHALAGKANFSYC